MNFILLDFEKCYLIPVHHAQGSFVLKTGGSTKPFDPAVDVLNGESTA
jgi:hypothetical protein